MGLIIDTSVIIETERKKINFMHYEKYEEAYISVISISKLLVRVYRANTEERKIKRAAFVENIINNIPSLSFQEEEARLYSNLIYLLWQKGITIGVHDIMIGATALVHGYSILTSNSADFSRIPGLSVINFESKI
ncbi:MAG: hypothetical protein B7Y25_00740 [Alphaproteobacteria bacterium 16-39-46]|nr:MAG: hypothetical protein B7Y25_00740 [Alphaproteobacteria bacterium 16-39-46]OZA44367.1 MAG: hypothetical protein B7X84_00745 [Alphaproteobacteria bacterium 17-39-52]HQS83435.1 PIN domain-containing protein [Alphaproteobacteria bacterium]HQS93199.1 PIN domain-containing protein [Alphaproteobacteria bacterium]